MSTLSNDLATYGALNTEALLDEALSDVATRLEADTLLAFLRDAAALLLLLRGAGALGARILLLLLHSAAARAVWRCCSC